MTGNRHSKDGMEYGGGYEDIVGMVGMSMICKGYGDTVGMMVWVWCAGLFWLGKGPELMVCMDTDSPSPHQGLHTEIVGLGGVALPFIKILMTRS